LSFVSLSWKEITDILAINWQNFATFNFSQVCFYNAALLWWWFCCIQF